MACNEIFFKNARDQFTGLFNGAKEKNELHFVLSLAPEFRPYTVNTTLDAQRAIDDYVLFLQKNVKDPIHPRVAMALYSHISEASGLWEIPKNLLSIIDGGSYDSIPFRDLVRKYGSKEGQALPTVNKVMRSLIAYSKKLNYYDLAQVFQGAFDHELRNAFAHADYALLSDGVCIGSRYNNERVISWSEFNSLLNKSLGFYESFKDVWGEHLSYYSTPRVVRGLLNDEEPESTWRISYKKGAAFEMIGGVGYEPDIEG